MWQITSLSPKALFRLKDQFEALGILEDEMELTWDEDIQVTTSSGPLLLEPDVVGMPATAVVTVEMYQNKEQNRVDEVRMVEDDTNKTPGKAAKKPSPKSNSGTSRRALR